MWTRQINALGRRLVHLVDVKELVQAAREELAGRLVEHNAAALPGNQIQSNKNRLET
jgi:hypothetical protein